MKNSFHPILSLALKQLMLLLLAAGILSALTIGFNLKWKPSSEFREMNGREARTHPNEVIFVDVRSKDRFEAAQIPGALHFDEQNSEAGIETIRSIWSPKFKILVYGEGTGSDRAQRVARLLKSALPSKNVLLLEGGWAAWPRD